MHNIIQKTNARILFILSIFTFTNFVHAADNIPACPEGIETMPTSCIVVGSKCNFKLSETESKICTCTKYEYMGDSFVGWGECKLLKKL